MRTLLWVEVLTATLIVLIGIVVVVRVASGHAPGHHPFTLNMFTVPPGIGTSTLFLGIVFGFLSFAGFEAAATLGEEAADPRRAIPRAIFGVALFGGVFYTIGTAVEMLSDLARAPRESPPSPPHLRCSEPSARSTSRPPWVTS